MTTLPPTSTSQISVKKLIVRLKEFHEREKIKSPYPTLPRPHVQTRLKTKRECGVSMDSLEAWNLRTG